MKAVFLRALEELNDKAAVLRAAVSAPAQALGRTRFEVAPDSFALVPRSPFAYWVSDQLRSLFADLPAFESAGRTAKQGLATADDFRFVRMWTELGATANVQRWYPFAKGGKFSPFYADVHLVVNWEKSGAEVKSLICHRYPYLDGKAEWVAKNIDYYFRPGLTWPRRTNGLSFRVMPVGCVFADKGPAAFAECDDRRALLVMCAIVNSAPFKALVSIQLARTELAQSFEVGLVQQTPVPALADGSTHTLYLLCNAAWSISRVLDTFSESSHAFLLPALLGMDGDNLASRAANWWNKVSWVNSELATIQAQLDDLCFDLYGIGGSDRQKIEQDFNTDLVGAEDEDAENGHDAKANDLDASALAASLMSWIIGVSFGRFDVRLGTRERSVPAEPDPFDPLPACSIGMLTGGNGLPSETPPQDYPIDFPRDGIFVDDPGTPRDLVAACRQVVELLYEEPAKRWDEACDILEDRATGMRTWLANQYFDQHIKCYSASHRKAPIYWQIATPSASYSVWLYCHRFTRDTLFRVLNDHVMPKLQHEERRLADMQEAAGPNASGSRRKQIDAQETLVGELRTMRDEVTRVAPLWNPNLDDGVILNFAPLWRLVPQHSSWQKECKSVWDRLCKGEYDWAHLAMHLWPERVVPKCATDRSLAIAHGLEDVFWRECADGKWQAAAASDAVVQKLIQERTIPAVKAALNGLLSAPTAIAGRQRRKKS